MTGTLENPAIGELNEKGDPKIVELVKQYNGLLNTENKFPGTSLAAAAGITSAQLADETIEAKKIKNAVITDAKLAKPPIVGQVSAAGGKVLGTGYSVEKTGTGTYKITLETELTTEGVMVVSCVSNNNVGHVSAGGKKTFTVAFVTLAETAQDCSFNFTVKAS